MFDENLWPAGVVIGCVLDLSCKRAEFREGTGVGSLLSLMHIIFICARSNDYHPPERSRALQWLVLSAYQIVTPVLRPSRSATPYLNGKVELVAQTARALRPQFRACWQGYKEERKSASALRKGPIPQKSKPWPALLKGRPDPRRHTGMSISTSCLQLVLHALQLAMSSASQTISLCLRHYPRFCFSRLRFLGLSTWCHRQTDVLTGPKED